MTNKELAKNVATWFESELMMKSEIATRETEDPEDKVEKDVERRAAIVSFSIELEKRVQEELREDTLISLQYRDEEDNLIKEIAENTGIKIEWIPEAYITVSQKTGISVFR